MHFHSKGLWIQTYKAANTQLISSPAGKGEAVEKSDGLIAEIQALWDAPIASMS